MVVLRWHGTLYEKRSPVFLLTAMIVSHATTTVGKFRHPRKDQTFSCCSINAIEHPFDYIRICRCA